MKHSYHETEKGFTLIEMVVYIGLFTILIGGAIVAAYDIYESSGRNAAKVIVQQEGNFLLAKIGWSLSGITSINAPAIGTIGSELLVTSASTTIGSIDIKPDTSLTNVVMVRNGEKQTLNNSNVTITNLQFDFENQNGVAWITSSFVLNTLTPGGKTLSQPFTATKYLRK